ncbi:MAG: tetratricopeptide repeat protein [Planctomycetaceae bacterium]|nr:tetratricopeptide repeat protein [Planctomycetaceae bacterium]MCB9953372.1 tetratricopeptide repeat protein [Planctomycetaceae bacterium]
MPRRILTLFCLLCLTYSAEGAEIDTYREEYQHGEYSQCLENVSAAIERGVYGEAWHQLKADAQIALGNYEGALLTLKEGVEKYGWSIRLRWQLMQIAPFAGMPELRESTAEEIAKLAQASPWRYTDAENLIVLGEWALSQGADAKDVQDKFYQRARRNNPLHRRPRLAIGALALTKRDFQFAAEVFREAVEQTADDPDYLFGLAQALHGSDPPQAAKLVDGVLEINPNHAAAQIWKADRFIEAERYSEALETLNSVLQTNPKHAEALAFQAAIAFVQADEARFNELRTQALSTWDKNPIVDHVIGRELSQKYRFAEGAKHQRLALGFDENYLDAKKQLAEDLLRLGEEEEGWQLAEEAAKVDGYDVRVYNLLTLHDEISKYATLEAEGLLIRMDQHEADVYGSYVVDLLKSARKELTERYQVELKQPTLVEIFPHPDDFAVRTFGLPGAGGYLGVCFGNVITANSPASQDARPVNWESVLWHEYTHVITLNKTHNRMPRWLSEGISVYEERRRHQTWGERMTPAYRDMILGDDLTPIGELSGAFLAPPSGLHLQFAYYESSLVVEFIVDQYGFDALLHILDDLAVGIPINTAIERHTDPLPKLEEDFKTHVTQLANDYAPGVDWSEPDIADLLEQPTKAGVLVWAKEHPANYRGLCICADLLVQQQKWENAKNVLEQVVSLFPGETGLASPTWQLAEVCRQLGNEEQEHEMLLAIANLDDDHAPALIRLLELEIANENWNAVREHAEQLRGIRSLISQPYKAILSASQHSEDEENVIPALQSLLALDPEDPAELHYQLAKQMAHQGQKETAKRQVLMALEYAPRFGDALNLLLELTASE